MSPSISTSFAAQIDETSTLLITGAGTDFTGAPISASGGTILSQTVLSETLVSVSFAAPASAGIVRFTDAGSGATCAVQIKALPIVERIRQNLVAAIGQINQANGYFSNPNVQELAYANGNANQLIILGLGESELVKPPEMMCDWRQTFYALCYVLPVDGVAGAAAAVDPQLLALFADVFAAAYLDRTRGGLAFDTVIQPPQFESNAEEAQFRAVITIKVRYRTLENDPTAQS